MSVSAETQTGLGVWSSTWAEQEMGDQDPAEFGSLEEEVKYWKEQAATHQQRWALCLGSFQYLLIYFSDLFPVTNAFLILNTKSI